MTERENQIIEIVAKTLKEHYLPTFNWAIICSKIGHRIYEFDKSFDIVKYQRYIQEERTENA